jgi:hypothetical protein
MEKHKNDIQQSISNDVTMDYGMDNNNMRDSNYFFGEG